MKKKDRLSRRQRLTLGGMALLLLAFGALLGAHHRLLAEVPPGRVEIQCATGAAPLLAALQTLLPDAPAPQNTALPADATPTPEDGASPAPEDTVPPQAPADPSPALDQVTTPAGMALALAQPLWEGEVLVLRAPDHFSAQWAAAGLSAAGLPVEDLQLRDYSWADAILRQSLWLWRLAAAWLYPLLFLRLAVWGLRRLAAGARRALARQYLGAYLYDAGPRLLAAAIVLVAGAVAAALALRWLLQAPLQLPSGWLTRGSLFDAARPRRWWLLHFGGQLTPYGQRLAALLRQSHLLAGLECLALAATAALAATLPKRVERGGQTPL